MSNDLISRSALIADMRSRKYIDKALCEIFETVVDEAPTAYDVDKVAERIKYRGKTVCCSVKCNDNCNDCEHGCLMNAIIKTVRDGG